MPHDADDARELRDAILALLSRKAAGEGRPVLYRRYASDLTVVARRRGQAQEVIVFEESDTRAARDVVHGREERRAWSPCTTHCTLGGLRPATSMARPSGPGRAAAPWK